ncbi:MAG: hydrogenase nickel incorporation protein HypA [Candidatus Bathyarchaeota archaeon]|nr:hydrogenase nickel incorporation protein HypA [Candidatus Bathyarchaeota archaeon]MDH5790798.1 hydrogenase nickel incorporation protein HypA [Candidatus Bathyarchaeota archaeon]
MHEWALAEGVVSTAVKIARAEGLSEITEVVVKIGELQQVEHDVLNFALEQLRKPMMKDARFVLETIPARLKCRVCGEEWRFSPEELSEEVSEAIHFVPEVAHVYIKCPGCGSPDFEVVEGRGVILASIKGVKKDE